MTSSSWLLALALGASSCGSCADTPAPGSAPSAAPSASASAPASAEPGDLAGPWDEAAAGDRLAQARLAQLYRADELMAVARTGRRWEAALAALELAADGEQALGDLAALARDPERGERALVTTLALARRPPRAGEALDAGSLARCIEGLDALGRDAAAPRDRRVAAANALRAFARAGYLDGARIPDVE